MPRQAFFRGSSKVVAAVCAAILFVSPVFSQSPGQLTALDRYVRQPDPAYSFHLVRTFPGRGVTGYLIEMTSQRWRSVKEVDHPVWRHWLSVVRPDAVKSSTGFLLIGGGSNDRPAPARIDPLLADMARDTGSVTAEIRQIPNQPLTFLAEGKPRSEDEIIAYTWDKYLKTGDASWPLRLPMTKAVVRAMDTISTFCATGPGGSVKVDGFVVAGASKRGWTTWTTAAVDPRVKGIVPIVIDLLNVEASFRHHFQVYGFYAPAVDDYVHLGIMDWMGTKEFSALMKLVDSYSYRQRYSMPKLLVNSAGDQFFVPDSWQFYYDNLPGEKHLRYVPNSDHSLKDTDASDTVAAFYGMLLRGEPRPEYSWRMEPDGSIRLETKTRPREVRLWQATNPEARDFRLEKIGPAYTSSLLSAESDGVYIGRVPKPAKGYTAFFLEMLYPTKGRHPLKLTTGVRVLPDTLPFPPPKPAPTGGP